MLRGHTLCFLQSFHLSIIPLALAIENATEVCYMFGGLISWFNDFYTLSILVVGNATEVYYMSGGHIFVSSPLVLAVENATWPCCTPAGITSEIFAICRNL